LESDFLHPEGIWVFRKRTIGQGILQFVSCDETMPGNRVGDNLVRKENHRGGGISFMAY
jgi:hypothetical protein